MISLCKDADAISSAVNSLSDNSCIGEAIRLYLCSYDTSYDFLEFYICYENEFSEVTAVIMRYNNTVYALIGGEITDEIIAFLSGFAGCELFSNLPLIDIETHTIYAVMSKTGESCNPNGCISVANNPHEISTLISPTMSPEQKTDFFLNTSHMLRHNTIEVWGYRLGDSLVCVVGESVVSENISYLNFVYTHEHFRGNGYCRKTLAAACNDPDKLYTLMCADTNVRFYEKCGFIKSAAYYKYIL